MEDEKDTLDSNLKKLIEAKDELLKTLEDMKDIYSKSSAFNETYNF